MPHGHQRTSRCREKTGIGPARVDGKLKKCTLFVVHQSLTVQYVRFTGSQKGYEAKNKKGDRGERLLRLILTGPGELGCRLYGAGFVGVGTQLLFVRAGVGRMFFWQGWFFDRLMGRVGQRVVERMMAGILKMTVPVHAGPFCRGRIIHRTFREWLSR